MRKSVILIPALNPPIQEFVQYINELICAGFDKIILVNDGSDKRYAKIFEELSNKEEISYLEHDKNFGKGRALKTGIKYFLDSYMNDKAVRGIITVDSDGQHLVKDVIKVSNALDNTTSPTLFLGTRDFDYDFVPFKSRFGNKITSILFAALNGKYLHDTQTGLRGISKDLLASGYLQLQGERFEYEINMLIYAVKKKQNIQEIPIETVYINANNETHFDPIKDSWKIYKVLLGQFVRYSCSSGISCIVDLVIFQFMLFVFAEFSSEMQIFISTVCARAGSSILNFVMNKRLVFNSSGDTVNQIIKYYTLCVLQMFVSATLVVGLHHIWGANKVFEKIIVDTCIFFVSYYIQKRIVFKMGDIC